jgi:hypothetical protein
VITKASKNFIRDSLYDPSAVTAMGWTALGDGAVAATSDDTALGNEIRRRAFDSESKPADRKWRTEIIIPAGTGTGEKYKEVGNFNQAALGGTMFNRQVFSEIEKLVDIELRVQVETEIVL